jgi:uncharacterized coiled-coil DUF342 family protein
MAKATLIEVKNEQRLVEVPASQEEHHAEAMALCQLLKNLATVRDEFKEVRREHRDKVDALTAAIDVTRQRVEKNTVGRTIEVLVKYDVVNARVTVIRDDTGEVFEEREMTPEELESRRQLSLVEEEPPDNVEQFNGGDR